MNLMNTMSPQWRLRRVSRQPAPRPPRTSNEALAIDAVEIDRIVPVSGNLGVCGQQFWLGPQRAGRKLTLWIDTTTVHLSLDGQHLKTLPSRLTSIDLPPPARPSWTHLTAGAQ